MFKNDLPSLHWRVVEVHPVERNTNNARGKITPQWRLSLKDLGQPGNRTVSRQTRHQKSSGKRKTQVRGSYEQVIQQHRHGDGDVFGAETRQERIHTVGKTVCSTRSRSNPLLVLARRSKAWYIIATSIHSYSNYGTIARKWLNIFKNCTTRIAWHMRKSCCASMSQSIQPRK